MRSSHAIAMTLAVALLTSCAHSGSGGSATNRRDATPRLDPDVITGDELARTTGGTLYDAVRTLRPAWMLRMQPTAVLQRQQGQLIVYVDGTRYGNLESLRQIVPSGIFSVRYYSPSNAEARFGPGHLLGAIEVTTRGH